MKKNDNIAGVSIITNLALTLGKIMAGIATNSVGIIASGIHSWLDLMASALAFYSASQATKPADDEHQYGHGKFQNVAAVAEALFILIAAIIILNKALPAIMQGTSNIIYPELGISVMGISALVSFFTAAVLASAYHRTMLDAFWESHRHLMVNGAASAVVCLGLAAVKFTGLEIIDSLLALMITLVLLKEGYNHLRKSAGGIFDVRLSLEEEKAIREVLAEHNERYVQYHALRTRRSGPDKYVDLHLVVPRDQIIYDTNLICKSIEECIKSRLEGANVLIHAEPCRPLSGECNNCGINQSAKESGSTKYCSALLGLDKE